MIEFNIIQTTGIILLGLLVGFLSGLFGAGGGFLITPALRIIFGIPYNIAVGSSLTAITFSSLYGMYKHHEQSHVNPTLGLIILGGVFPGVEIGARILVRLKNSGVIDITLNLCYVILLITAAVIMFMEYRKWTKNGKCPQDLSCYKTGFYFFKKKPHKNKHQLNIMALMLYGFGTGILVGLLGVGGGFILIPALVNFFSLPAVIVIGTSLLIVCLSSAFGAAIHILKGNVNIILVLLLLSGSIIGSYFGTSLTEKFRGRKIRKYFIFIILLAIIMIFIGMLS